MYSFFQPDVVVLITLKMEGSNGHLLLRGAEKVLDNENVKVVGEKLAELLGGKGTMRDSLYQAKVTKINAANKAFKLCQEHVPNGNN